MRPHLLLVAAAVAWASAGLAACSGGGTVGSGDVPETVDAVDVAAGDTAPDVATTDAPDALDADSGAPDADADDADASALGPGWDDSPVNGWILLDPDPASVEASIQAAAAYGVNHVQLSHGLIMNIEDVLGAGPEVEARVETLNQAIALAHEHGMEAFVWAHELSGDPPDATPCYEPGSDLWQGRAQAYRDGLARIPDVDGVVLMFGSAPMPPWFTVCDCAWCEEGWEGGPWDKPPAAEKLEMVVEQVGGVIVNELGKRLLVRTFVHEPNEVPWHSDGLAAAEGVPFAGMHKGPVQDWQPYNPTHPCLGAIGDHRAMMELDLAGEYVGRSVLPYVAPGYFRYRLRALWEAGGVGVAARVQRGSDHAVGTPNEINVLAVGALLQDHHASLDTLWDEALSKLYGVAPDAPAQPLLRQVLSHTFPIRRKSHYVLGLWALEKGSDLPDGAETDQLHDRGKMPKWDPDWQAVWDRVAEPDRQTVVWIWQEGTEAITLAEASLAAAPGLEDALGPEAWADLGRRLRHQRFAAEAWRAVELFIWAGRAAAAHPEDAPELRAWQRWAHEELADVAERMKADGLGDVPLAGPARIEAFRTATADDVPTDVDPARPDVDLFSPVEVVSVGPAQAEVRFSTRRDADVSVDYGLEIPDYGQTVEAGQVTAGEGVAVTLTGMDPGRRYVVRLRATEGDVEVRGGDFWIFTPWE